MLLGRLIIGTNDVVIDYKGQSLDYKRAGSSIGWVFAFGILVVFLVLAAYAALQARKMSGDGVVYSLLNFVGAAGILCPVLYAAEMNWSVLFIEAIWVLISLYGMWRSMTRGLRKAPPAA